MRLMMRLAHVFNMRLRCVAIVLAWHLLSTAREARTKFLARAREPTGKALTRSRERPGRCMARVRKLHIRRVSGKSDGGLRKRRGVRLGAKRGVFCVRLGKRGEVLLRGVRRIRHLLRVGRRRRWGRGCCVLSSVVVDLCRGGHAGGETHGEIHGVDPYVAGGVGDVAHEETAIHVPLLP